MYIWRYVYYEEIRLNALIKKVMGEMIESNFFPVFVGQLYRPTFTFKKQTLSRRYNWVGCPAVLHVEVAGKFYVYETRRLT